MNGTPNVLRLSEHYMLSDLTFSEYATRHNIDNTPSPKIIDNLREVAYALEDIQRGLGYFVPFVTSGYRCAAVNKGVGGSKASAHMKGFAADIVCPGYGSALKLCQYIEKSGVAFDQLIHEYQAWVHLSVAPRMRQMILTKVHGQPYSVGLLK